MAEVLLKVKEVAEILRCHPGMVYKLLRAGELPSIRLGVDYRILQSALEDWIKKQEGK